MRSVDTEVPVTLFVFNRSEQLVQTLESLRNNKIPKLYVFSDGPRDKRDLEDIKKVRAMIDAIDWVDVTKKYRDENKGLSKSIEDGLNEVFKKAEAVIVVEDDVCVAPGFYEFMKYSLYQYADDSKVACVTGLRYPFDRSVFKNYEYDVFFTRRFSSWGWATWKRFWQSVEFDGDNL